MAALGLMCTLRPASGELAQARLHRQVQHAPKSCRGCTGVLGTESPRHNPYEKDHGRPHYTNRAEEKLGTDRQNYTRDGGEHPPTETFATPRTPKASPRSPAQSSFTEDFLEPKMLIFESQRPTLERSPSQTSVQSVYSRVSSETSPPQKISERPASSQKDSTCPDPTQ